MDLVLEKLIINNFKNLQELELQLNPKLNSFVGLNGVGKTNILDAIYYLSFTKSYFNIPDQQNIRHSETFFSLRGIYNRLGTKEEISITVQKEQKTVKHNGKKYKKLSKHIGLIPAVIITPDDIKLINGSGDERRRFMDIIISQANPQYIKTLSNYKKILNQRNQLIKTFAREGYVDEDTLEIWDEQLSEAAQYIYEQRRTFIEEFIPIFQHYYTLIAQENERVSIDYRSHLKEQNYLVLLKDNLKKDLALNYTYYGIHRDDLGFMINRRPVRKFASQGQQKSFLIALKFAQHDFIKKHLKIKPLLLLDDIFDKLDPLRVEKLVSLVSDNLFGQIFITHTNHQRLKQIFHNLQLNYKIFFIDNGKISNTSEN